MGVGGGGDPPSTQPGLERSGGKDVQLLVSGIVSENGKYLNILFSLYYFVYPLIIDPVETTPLPSVARVLGGSRGPLPLRRSPTPTSCPSEITADDHSTPRTPVCPFPSSRVELRDRRSPFFLDPKGPICVLRDPPVLSGVWGRSPGGGTVTKDPGPRMGDS